MAEEYTYYRLQFGLSGVGFVNLLAEGTITFTGDGEDLIAMEGQIGTLEPLQKGMELSGAVYIPQATEAYKKIQEYWKAGTEITMTAFYGNQAATADGKFNAPNISDNGTKMNFTFRGKEPRFRTIS